MPITRRQFLQIGTLISAGAALASCAPLYARAAGQLEQPSGWLAASREPSFAQLRRLTFGPTLAERSLVSQTGIQSWIEDQLSPAGIDDTACELRIRHLETLSWSAAELADFSDKIFDDLDLITVPTQLRQGTLLRQVYSRRQINEQLVEFWSDHFNISTDKGDCWFLKTVDDREVIRRHVFGRFEDLLMASAHSPAMLVYLDNQANQKGTPNENYARELLELHTLGIDGGYTQNDIMQLARCLTGWTVKDHFWRGQFTFKPDIHDPSPKSLLGLSISPAGQSEAEQVIQVLANHPSTARFIAYKLARRLISDTPPQHLVEKAANTFNQTRGDLGQVVRTLLLDGTQFIQPKYSRPVRYVASALRTLEAETDAGEVIQGYLARMGQVPFAWPTPDGYPDTAAVWQGNLLPRWQFAIALASGNLAGTKLDLPGLVVKSAAQTPGQLLEQLSHLLLGFSLPNGNDLLAVIRDGEISPGDLAPTLVASLLASPSYQWF